MKKIFNPNTVAVFGATNRKESIGYSVMNNIIGAGYEGVIYPVNLKRNSVFGIKAYKNIKEINDTIDLAVIATPFRTIVDIVKQCGENGVGGIVILTPLRKDISGGKRVLRKIKRLGEKFGIRIIGPNSLGFISTKIRLNVSIANKMALEGNIAFISQSQGLATAVLDWSIEEKVGFSHFISIGSKVDVGFGDIIDYLDTDSNTSSIIIYMESLENAKKFISAARAYSRNKPIFVLKADNRSHSVKIELSHSGTIMGSKFAYEAAFRRAGVVSVKTIDQLFNGAQALAKQPRPKSDKLTIITNSNGPGVLALDLLKRLKGDVSCLSELGCDELKASLNKKVVCKDFVNLLDDASPEDYRIAAEICLKDDNIDTILVILTPKVHTDPIGIAREIVGLSHNTDKTILASWMGSEVVEDGMNVLDEGGIPTFLTPEKAIITFIDMVKYTKLLSLVQETPYEIPSQFIPRTVENKRLINSIVEENRYVLNAMEAAKVLQNYHIPVVKNLLVKDAVNSGIIAAEIGFPVVLKISSPDILHKSEVEGVILNINSKKEAEKAFLQIIDSVKSKYPDAKIDGVLVEQMVKKKYELIIGAKKDSVFGPIILFGMGGIAVELFKDLDVGLPPLNMALAQRMIERTKIYQLLKGYHGMEGVDIKSIRFLLYKFAYLVMDFPEIKEIDINPFAVDSDSGLVLDTRIILDEEFLKSEKPAKPYSHLVISPYPKQYVYNIKVKGGLDVTIRPIKPEDEPLEKEMFTNLSKETQYFRFFGYIKDITHEMLVRYTHIDYEREMALMAEIEEEGKKKMIGVVRIVKDKDNQSAEFAIVVADPWQGLGLGSKLMDLILDISKKDGLKSIYAVVLKENETMVQMFKKRGFVLKSMDITTYRAEMSFIS